MYETEEELKTFFKALFDMKMMRVLGEGAFGLAILAMDETEQIRKVFKLPKNERTTEALKIEARNLRKLENLSSPYIIRLYKHGRVEIDWHGRREERHYLCLAFGGTSLRHKLGNLREERDGNGNASYHGSGQRLPIDEAVRIGIEVCQGLEAAHGFQDSEIRIVHRDIKPENILIDDDSDVTRIADFGISRVVDRSTGIHSIAGTLLYMDPQCFEHNAGTYSDLYSLGIVLYEMLTGQLPFENYQVRTKQQPDDPRKHVPEIPAELASIVLKALELDLSCRYATATEMLNDLRRVSAALNPLPASIRRIQDLGSERFLCEEVDSRKRVVVHVVQSQATLKDLAVDMVALEDLAEPGIVKALRHFRNEHMLGIVSPLPRGRCLDELFGTTVITDAQQLTRFCDVMVRVCEIVSSANDRGVAHGFISPKQIWCEGDRSTCVHGFGTAPVLGARAPGPAHAPPFLRAFGDHMPFMSPQVLAGGSAPTPGDDAFSIGAVMYRLLTGHPHAERDVIEQLARGDTVVQALVNPRELNGVITRRLAGILVRALDWNPHTRLGTPREVAEALGECRWPDDIVDALIQDAQDRYEDDDVLAAYELLDKALEVDPGNDRAHYMRGWIYFSEREYKWALLELAKAAEVAPSLDVYTLMGRCHTACEHRDQAAQMFAEALRYGESAEVRQSLAYVLKEQDKLADACEQMRQSIMMESDESIRERREYQLKQWQAESRSARQTETLE